MHQLFTGEKNINQTLKNACRYVRNTNGCATKAHFAEDHEPIGEQLWGDMKNAGLVREDEYMRIFLTDAGVKLLDA